MIAPHFASWRRRTRSPSRTLRKERRNPGIWSQTSADFAFPTPLKCTRRPSLKLPLCCVVCGVWCVSRFVVTRCPSQRFEQQQQQQQLSAVQQCLRRRQHSDRQQLGAKPSRLGSYIFIARPAWKHPGIVMFVTVATEEGNSSQIEVSAPRSPGIGHGHPLSYMYDMTSYHMTKRW